MAYTSLYGDDWSTSIGQSGNMKEYLDNYARNLGVKPEDLGFGDNVNLQINAPLAADRDANGVWREWIKKSNDEVVERSLAMAGKNTNNGEHGTFAHEMFHYQDGKAPPDQLSELQKHVYNDKYMKKMLGTWRRPPEQTASGADIFMDLLSKPGPHSQQMVPKKTSTGVTSTKWVIDKNGERRWITNMVPKETPMSQKTFEMYSEIFNSVYPSRRPTY